MAPSGHMYELHESAVKDLILDHDYRDHLYDGLTGIVTLCFYTVISGSLFYGRD